MKSLDQIKQLREETGVSISECKKALEQAKGDFEKAKELLRKLGQKFAEQRKEKETKSGIIDSYIHGGGKIGAMIELNCESDFVARSEDFRKLAHELSLQVSATSAPDIKTFLSQPWIKDESREVKDLINEYSAKFGENIILKRFQRYEL